MPRATRMTFSKRMVMNSIKVARLCAAMATVLFSSPVSGYLSQYSRWDPYPVFTASNALGPFTYLSECEPSQNARISASFFRQAGNRSGLASTCIPYQPTSLKGSTDVETGDIYGPWNIMALFYPEACPDANGSTTAVQCYLLNACTGCSCAECSCPVAPCQDVQCATDADLKALRKYMNCPQTNDPNHLFGCMSIPTIYRKYGGRFQIEVGTPYGLGVRAEGSFGRIVQTPCFDDLTSEAIATVYPTEDQTRVSKFLMRQFTSVIAKALDIDADPYCASDVDTIRISAYLCHAFEANGNKEKGSYMPKLTFVPYVEFECAPIVATSRPYSSLFSIPFGNDGHKAIGLTAGFTLNFIDMFTIGLDGGMTHFSSECHHNCPVPTNEMQVGVYSRKADLVIQPGKNFTFGGTIAADYFWYNFSTWIEFRMIHHCCDSIQLANLVNVPGSNCNQGGLPANYPASNIMLDVLQKRSQWSSSFANVGLTYDIADALSLGFFWQAPIRQRFAPRPTTLMWTISGIF